MGVPASILSIPRRHGASRSASTRRPIAPPARPVGRSQLSFLSRPGIIAKRTSDPFSLSDEELLEEIIDLHRQGHDAEAVTRALEEQYGASRVDRFDLVSVILHLVHQQEE